MDQRQDGFPAFVAEHEQQLRGTALLLTADPAEADDLLVAALARTHRRWRRFGSPAAALTDAREALLSAALGRTRLPAAGRGSALVAGRQHEPDRRWLRALAELDARTRAVAVLRLHEGEEEDAVAMLLGCSPAEVGAALADALDTLSPLLVDEPAPPTEPADQVVDPQPAPAVPDRPGPPVPSADPADPYAIYRHPGTPAPRPDLRPPPPPSPASSAATSPASSAGPAPRPARSAAPTAGSVPGPAAVRPHPDDDPYAIYRRPT
ncbi:MULTISPECIES: hypothetical protein [unclassified Modestobacter]|uniref:hypothetical protein n=1 Tax=unclassified Modestobacter TaxID=2643866 RepID=UPI0022AB1D76|nr:MULTISPECIES: hypothetical protein [unclassified Modestobacter]MCZ2826477.1 hypothetical protein [Modestobacter sp. VKM Ac-2981]MCZ2852458.1 hypothetical protein [Modestobacter sp. VKM Ac-2982]